MSFVLEPNTHINFLESMLTWMYFATFSILPIPAIYISFSYAASDPLWSIASGMAAFILALINFTSRFESPLFYASSLIHMQFAGMVLVVGNAPDPTSNCTAIVDALVVVSLWACFYAMVVCSRTPFYENDMLLIHIPTGLFLLVIFDVSWPWCIIYCFFCACLFGFPEIDADANELKPLLSRAEFGRVSEKNEVFYEGDVIDIV